MRCRSLCHALALVACAWMAAPAWGANHATNPPAPPAPVEGAAAVGAAQALIDAGRFEAAIVALRPLLGQQPVDANVLFLYGLASLEAAQRPGRADDQRDILLNEAIAAFRAMLVNAPELVRVRLELARAFFFNGQDGLARRHFRLALAGGVPPPVAANIGRFLNLMRARKRWSGYFGAAIAPDSNLNAASDTETIYIDIFGTRLPFERQGDFGARSGLGLSIWGGGEYQQPLSQSAAAAGGRRRGAAGLLGRRFRSAFLLAAHVGPRWLAGPRTEDQPARRRRIGSGSAAIPYIDETGVRLELDRRLAPRLVGARQRCRYAPTRPSSCRIFSTVRSPISSSTWPGRRRPSCGCR